MSIFNSVFGVYSDRNPILYRFFYSLLSFRGYDMYSLDKDLQFFDKAVREVFGKFKNKDGVLLIDFVSDETDFNKLLGGLIKRHLSSIMDGVVLYEIISDSVSDVLVKNLKKHFYNFDGFFKGNKISIEAYLSTFMGYAIMNNKTSYYSKLKRKKDLVIYDNENFEQALDRILWDKINYNDVGVDSLVFKDLKEGLVKYLSNKIVGSDEIIVVLEMLIKNFKGKEISRELGIDYRKVSGYIKRIRELFDLYSKKLKRGGDSSLFDAFEDYKSSVGI